MFSSLSHHLGIRKKGVPVPGPLSIILYVTVYRIFELWLAFLGQGVQGKWGNENLGSASVLFILCVSSPSEMKPQPHFIHPLDMLYFVIMFVGKQMGWGPLRIVKFVLKFLKCFILLKYK